jgi:hypothetical protein
MPMKQRTLANYSKNRKTMNRLKERFRQANIQGNRYQ